MDEILPHRLRSQARQEASLLNQLPEFQRKPELFPRTESQTKPKRVQKPKPTPKTPPQSEAMVKPGSESEPPLLNPQEKLMLKPKPRRKSRPTARPRRRYKSKPKRKSPDSQVKPLPEIQAQLDLPPESPPQVRNPELPVVLRKDKLPTEQTGIKPEKKDPPPPAGSHKEKAVTKFPKYLKEACREIFHKEDGVKTQAVEILKNVKMATTNIIPTMVCVHEEERKKYSALVQITNANKDKAIKTLQAKDTHVVGKAVRAFLYQQDALRDSDNHKPEAEVEMNAEPPQPHSPLKMDDMDEDEDMDEFFEEVEMKPTPTLTLHSPLELDRTITDGMNEEIKSVPMRQFRADEEEDEMEVELVEVNQDSPLGMYDDDDENKLHVDTKPRLPLMAPVPQYFILVEGDDEGEIEPKITPAAVPEIVSPPGIYDKDDEENALKVDTMAVPKLLPVVKNPPQVELEPVPPRHSFSLQVGIGDQMEMNEVNLEVMPVVQLHPAKKKKKHKVAESSTQAGSGQTEMTTTSHHRRPKLGRAENLPHDRAGSCPRATASRESRHPHHQGPLSQGPPHSFQQRPWLDRMLHESSRRGPFRPPSMVMAPGPQYYDPYYDYPPVPGPFPYGYGPHSQASSRPRQHPHNSRRHRNSGPPPIPMVVRVKSESARKRRDRASQRAQKAFRTGLNNVPETGGVMNLREMIQEAREEAMVTTSASSSSSSSSSSSESNEGSSSSSSSSDSE